MTNPNRYYVNTSLPSVLNASASSSVTSLTVTQTSNFSTSVLPSSIPFTLLLEWGTANFEVVTVTQLPTQTGGVVTFGQVTRGADGTGAVSHAANAAVAHGFSARDLSEPQAHMAASQAVHGLVSGSSVAGTNDVQTLNNKQVYAANPVSGGTEGWHPLTLINGWANNGSFGEAKYRLLASPPNTVELTGAIIATSAASGAFAQLSSDYQPASAQGYAAGATGSMSTGTSGNVRCDTSGNLSINNTVVPNGSTFFIHGFISLDA